MLKAPRWAALLALGLRPPLLAAPVVVSEALAPTLRELAVWNSHSLGAGVAGRLEVWQQLRTLCIRNGSAATFLGAPLAQQQLGGARLPRLQGLMVEGFEAWRSLEGAAACRPNLPALAHVYFLRCLCLCLCLRHCCGCWIERGEGCAHHGAARRMAAAMRAAWPGLELWRHRGRPPWQWEPEYTRM